jgi:hypothetical protein
MLFEQKRRVVPGTFAANARFGCSRILRRRIGERNARHREVAVAGEEVRAERDPRGVEAVARERAGLGHRQDVGAVLAAHAQHDGGIGRLLPPIPVVGMQESPVRGDGGERHHPGAAILHLLVDLGRFLEAEHHLGAAVHRDDAFERQVRPFRNPAQLLEIGGIEIPDDRDEAPRKPILCGGVDVALGELVAIEGDAAGDALGNRAALGEPAFARGARDFDAGEIGSRVTHARGVQGEGSASLYYQF